MKKICRQCKKTLEEKEGFYQDSNKRYFQPCKKCFCENRKKVRKAKKDPFQ